MATQIIPPVVPSVKSPKTINPERRRQSHGAAWSRNGQFQRMAALNLRIAEAAVSRRRGAGSLRPCDIYDRDPLLAGLVEWKWARNREVCGGVDARFLLPAPKAMAQLPAPKIAGLLPAPQEERWVAREVSAFFRVYARQAGVEARKAVGAVETTLSAANRESTPITCGENGKSGQSCGSGQAEAGALMAEALAEWEKFCRQYAEYVNRKGKRSYRDYCIIDDADRSVARLFRTLAHSDGWAVV